MHLEGSRTPAQALRTDAGFVDHLQQFVFKGRIARIGITGKQVPRSRALGAEIVRSNADLCARFLFAPRYPIWLKLWFADEELPASGRLLLDTSAPQYLTIEDAVTAGTILLDALTSI